MWWSIGQITTFHISHSSYQAVNASARHHKSLFSRTSALYPNFLTCPSSTTTPAAPGCLVLPLHYLNREAKSMKNGLCGIHPSKPGMLSAAFIRLSDLLLSDHDHLYHLLVRIYFFRWTHFNHSLKLLSKQPLTLYKTPQDLFTENSETPFQLIQPGNLLLNRPVICQRFTGFTPKYEQNKEASWKEKSGSSGQIAGPVPRRCAAIGEVGSSWWEWVMVHLRNINSPDNCATVYWFWAVWSVVSKALYGTFWR